MPTAAMIVAPPIWVAIVLMPACLWSQEAAPRPKQPPPDPAQEKAAEATVKAIFKEEYSKRAREERIALARKMVEHASLGEDSSHVIFVLLREAREIAAAEGDVETAYAAIEAAAKRFEVDAVKLKSEALARAERAVKNNEEFDAMLAERYCALAEEAVAADNYPPAAAAVAKAQGLAKKIEDVRMEIRSSQLREEVAILAAEHPKVKAAAASAQGADYEAVGKFTCFGKGDWKRGLAAFVKAEKSAFKGPAERDLAEPKDPIARMEVGHGWWDLAQKEKGELRRRRIRERAAHWYRLALPDLVGVSKLTVEKRLEELARAEVLPGEVDLLKLIDVKKGAVNGEFKMVDGSLVTPPGVRDARVEIPYVPPRVYELEMNVVRLVGGNDLIIGLVVGGAQCAAWLDGFGSSASGLSCIDGKMFFENETHKKGTRLFDVGAERVVRVRVELSGVQVWVQEEGIIDWKGDPTRLSLHESTRIRRPDILFIGGWETSWKISKFQLTPLRGKGKVLK